MVKAGVQRHSHLSWASRGTGVREYQVPRDKTALPVLSRPLLGPVRLGGKQDSVPFALGFVFIHSERFTFALGAGPKPVLGWHPRCWMAHSTART